MLFFIDKSRKRDVTDLNFFEPQMLYCADDIRSLYSLPNSRFDHLPLDQEWNQGSHPDRFEGTNSGLRVRVFSQHARCEEVGHADV